MYSPVSEDEQFVEPRHPRWKPKEWKSYKSYMKHNQRGGPYGEQNCQNGKRLQDQSQPRYRYWEPARLHSHHHHEKKSCETKETQSQPEPVIHSHSHRSKRKHKHHKRHSRSLSVERKHEKEGKSTSHKSRSRDDPEPADQTFIGELLKHSKISKQESSELLESFAKHQAKKKDVEEGEIESDREQNKTEEDQAALTETRSFTPPIHLMKTKSFTPPIHLLKVTIDQNQNEVEPDEQSFVTPVQELKPVEAPPPKKKNVLDLPMPPIDFTRPISFNLKRPAPKALSPAQTEFKVKKRDEHYNEVCEHLTINPTVISPNEPFVDSQPHLKCPKILKPRPTIINRRSPQREYLERSFESYKMIKLIGEGTYGRVFKAKDLITNELVALKYVRMEKEVEGFPITGLREIKILRELRHPNIVDFQEIVQREGNDPKNNETFLVFEYMNHDLMGLLDNPATKFDEDSIFLIFKQLLEGLKYCHKREILHRDLKCSNILLNKNGAVKLADFGLGRQWIADRPFTNKVISLWYRPIELLLGEEKYGPPVDIWSLGCILGELFQRRPVFPFGTEIDIIHAIFNLCGTPTKNSWPKVKLLPGFATLTPVATRRMLFEVYKTVMPPLALDLFDKMLKLNPASRITAEEALQSNWITVMSGKKHIKPLQLPDEDDCHELDAKMRRKKRASSQNNEKN